MPAFIAAHPWMTFFIALAGIGAVETILKPAGAATSAPPSGSTPTTTGAWPYQHPAQGYEGHRGYIGRQGNDMIGAMLAPAWPSLPTFGMKAPAHTGVYSGLIRASHVQAAKKAMSAIGA